MIYINEKKDWTKYTALWYPRCDWALPSEEPMYSHLHTPCSQELANPCHKGLTYTYAAKLLQKGDMAYLVECFAKIEKYKIYHPSIVQCQGNIIVAHDQLVNCGMLATESELLRGQDLMLHKVRIQFFDQNLFNCLTGDRRN